MNRQQAYWTALVVATGAYAVSSHFERKWHLSRLEAEGMRITSSIGGQKIVDFRTTNFDVVSIEWTTNVDLTVSGRVVTNSLLKELR